MSLLINNSVGISHCDHQPCSYTLYKKRLYTIIVGDSTVKHLHGNSITNKTSNDKIILVKPFPEARHKSMKHYVISDLEKNPGQQILHNGTNKLKFVSSPEQISNEIISLTLSIFRRLLRGGDRFSKKAKDVKEWSELQCKDHNVDFINHKNRTHRNQEPS